MTVVMVVFTYLLCCKMACQDNDEEETEDEEQAEHDCALVESAGELMPTLVKLISGPTFAPYFADLLPELLKRLVTVTTTDITYCKPVLLYAVECFNMSCSVESQLCRAWRCVYWKVFKVKIDEAVDFIQTGIRLCALDSEISCRKLSFIRKLFSSPNSVIKRLAKLNL